MRASVRSLKNLPLDIEGPQARSEEESEEGSEGWGVAAESEAIEGGERVERGGAEESEEDNTSLRSILITESYCTRALIVSAPS